MTGEKGSSASSSSAGEPGIAAPRTGPSNVLRLWFGVTDRVGPATYALSGLALMLLKYAVEALAIWWYTSSIFAPWDFVNPLLTARTEILRSAPEWLPAALFLWTLPFLWIAISMSVRRVIDAGLNQGIAHAGHRYRVERLSGAPRRRASDAMRP